MKNTENAAMPISAMSQRLFFPRRLSGRPEQVSRSADMRSSTVPTPGLNLTRHQLDTVYIHPDSISRTLRKAALPAKMRIAGSETTYLTRTKPCKNRNQNERPCDTGRGCDNGSNFVTSGNVDSNL